jgi:tetratricopeptide (TPR) repeat protein
MRGDVGNEQLIRKYLLGELTEDERSQIESGIMTDGLLFERVQMAEDELIEDYLYGRLSAEDRKKFEQSFLCTAEGREQVNLTRDLINYSSSGKGVAAAPGEARQTASRRRFFGPGLVAAASILLVASAGFVAWRLLAPDSKVEQGIAALKRAYRDARPLEARVSALDYAPMIVQRGDDSQGVDANARNQADILLLDAASNDPGPESHHALGLAYLTKKDFDRAIAEFEKALAADPDNARAHSDLGAALLEKGKADRLGDEPGRSLEEFARSLEHLNKAIELDASLLEPLFNRAHLYQEMKLPQQAEEDWKAYLEKDPNSDWADEARRNLEALEQRKNRSAKSREQLYKDFADARERGDDDAAWRVLSEGRTGSGNLIIQGLLDAHTEALE